MLHNLRRARRHALAILASITVGVTGAPLHAQSSGGAERPVWNANGRPTRQALAVIDILGNVATRGLDPRDYDSAELANMARALSPSSDSSLS